MEENPRLQHNQDVSLETANSGTLENFIEKRKREGCPQYGAMVVVAVREMLLRESVLPDSPDFLRLFPRAIALLPVPYGVIMPRGVTARTLNEYLEAKCKGAGLADDEWSRAARTEAEYARKKLTQFFWLGKKVVTSGVSDVEPSESAEAFSKRLIDAGHEIANTYEHYRIQANARAQTILCYLAYGPDAASAPVELCSENAVSVATIGGKRAVMLNVSIPGEVALGKAGAYMRIQQHATAVAFADLIRNALRDSASVQRNAIERIARRAIRPGHDEEVRIVVRCKTRLQSADRMFNLFQGDMYLSSAASDELSPEEGVYRKNHGLHPNVPHRVDVYTAAVLNGEVSPVAEEPKLVAKQESQERPDSFYQWLADVVASEGELTDDHVVRLCILHPELGEISVEDLKKALFRGFARFFIENNRNPPRQEGYILNMLRSSFKSPVIVEKK